LAATAGDCGWRGGARGEAVWGAEQYEEVCMGLSGVGEWHGGGDWVPACEAIHARPAQPGTGGGLYTER